MKTLGKIVLVFVILYLTSYIVLRSRWTHTWDKDGRRYMHFPVAAAWLQSAYAPATLLDEKLSGLRFRVGPHPGTEPDVDTRAPAVDLLLRPENAPGDRPVIPGQPAPDK